MYETLGKIVVLCVTTKIVSDCVETPIEKAEGRITKQIKRMKNRKHNRRPKNTIRHYRLVKAK